MRKILITTASLLALATPALADNHTLGSAIGGAVGAVVDLPGNVLNFVTGRPVESSVVFEGDIVVGEPLPEVIVIEPVPDDDTYAYAVVNERRVIVDRDTRRVVRIID